MDRTKNLILTLSSFNSVITRSGVTVSAGMISLMTVVVVVGVFFRYVLNNSITWVEDFSLIMMVSTAFIVAPYAYRNGANVAISFITDHLPARFVRLLNISINILILWVIYRYFLESLALVERGWGIRVNSIPIAWAWCYMIVPVCFVAMALVAFELLMRDVYKMTSANRDAPLSDDENTEA